MWRMFSAVPERVWKPCSLGSTNGYWYGSTRKECIRTTGKCHSQDMPVRESCPDLGNAIIGTAEVVLLIRIWMLNSCLHSSQGFHGKRFTSVTVLRLTSLSFRLTSQTHVCFRAVPLRHLEKICGSKTGTLQHR